MDERKITIPEVIRMMNWTQEEIAQMLACSPSTIRRKMAGESEWTATDIKIILGASGIAISQIAL
jgi:transcriptional regulator with XRE-family HTH domain